MTTHGYDPDAGKFYLESVTVDEATGLTVTKRRYCCATEDERDEHELQGSLGCC